jgi:hypothetical protein
MLAGCPALNSRHGWSGIWHLVAGGWGLFIPALVEVWAQSLIELLDSIIFFAHKLKEKKGKGKKIISTC